MRRLISSPSALTRRGFLAAVFAAALAAGALGPVTSASAEGVRVFAAASLSNALDAIGEAWRASGGEALVASYAGSSALARQIQAGAPADIFISASVDWMDAVEASGDLREGTRRELLGNTLVLVAHGADAAPVEIAPGFDLAGLLGDERLAMALVDSVPAGVYGKAALTSLGVWEAIAPKVAQSDNVRAALALVATGEAPYGIVYASDAVAEQGVSVVATFPADSHAPIVYPAAVLADSQNPRAEAFLDFLEGEEARALFRAEGFTVLE